MAVVSPDDRPMSICNRSVIAVFFFVVFLLPLDFFIFWEYIWLWVVRLGQIFLFLLRLFRLT